MSRGYEKVIEIIKNTPEIIEIKDWQSYVDSKDLGGAEEKKEAKEPETAIQPRMDIRPEQKSSFEKRGPILSSKEYSYHYLFTS